MIVSEAPQNLIGDNAYDSDKLDTELRRYGIELIAPHLTAAGLLALSGLLACLLPARHAIGVPPAEALRYE
jgi:ABC-type lipoprotein release transport system permease subunit